nr:hypothetical protein [Tanacetum cinerariifolium]
MPEELALNHTKPSLDGKHVSDDLEQRTHLVADVDFFFQVTIYECCLDIHLIDGHGFTGDISDEDSYSLDAHSLSSFKLQPPISHQGVVAGSTIIEDNPFDHADNDPFVNVFTLVTSSEASSSRDASSAESTHLTQQHNHLEK